jgi:hypothetical protein
MRGGASGERSVEAELTAGGCVIRLFVGRRRLSLGFDFVGVSLGTGGVCAIEYAQDGGVRAREVLGKSHSWVYQMIKGLGDVPKRVDRWRPLRSQCEVREQCRDTVDPCAHGSVSSGEGAALRPGKQAGLHLCESRGGSRDH